MESGNNNNNNNNVDNTQELPGLVRSFVLYFTRYLEEGNVTEIYSIYENSFNKLTERFYKSSPWPPASSLASLLGTRRLPTLLYKELYFRHVYSRLTATLQDRIDSWKNYLELFEVLLSSDRKSKLPHSWLFDLTDEFVWQAQSFNHYRCKLKSLSPQDRAILAKNADVWSLVEVIKLLERIAKESKIRELLQKEDGDATLKKGGDDLSVLGYFSLVAQLRVYCMLGDYHFALRAIDNVKMLSGNDEDCFCSAVTACHVTLYYYAGFCFLMLHRYSDASECFSSNVLFLSRTKQSITKSYQSELIVKKQDQMVALLAISMCMVSPKYVDGILEDMLREKHGDQMVRLRKGEVQAFDELFVLACPKFLAAAVPSLDPSLTTNLHLEPLRYQQSLFLAEVKQQTKIPIIRSYLKLYSSIDTTKLAGFLGTSVEEVRALLISYKHKTRSFERSGSSFVSGHWNDQVTGDLNFFVDCDMVHVTETKTTPNFVAPFLESIHKLDDMLLSK